MDWKKGSSSSYSSLRHSRSLAASSICQWVTSSSLMDSIQPSSLVNSSLVVLVRSAPSANRSYSSGNMDVSE